MLDEPTLLLAARVQAIHRLSFADTLIAAYAMQHKAIIVHKDPEFETLTGQVGLETLPPESLLCASQ
jgi:predicted nucleic acid-binding protein